MGCGGVNPSIKMIRLPVVYVPVPLAHWCSNGGGDITLGLLPDDIAGSVADGDDEDDDWRSISPITHLPSSPYCGTRESNALAGGGYPAAGYVYGCDIGSGVYPVLISLISLIVDGRRGKN